MPTRTKSTIRPDDKVIIYPVNLSEDARGPLIPESKGYTIDRMPYLASMVPLLSKWQLAVVTVTDASAFTIQNPNVLFSGAQFILVLKNATAGALGAVSLGSKYKTAGAIVTPAAGKRRVYAFYYDTFDDVLVELFRSPSDVG